MPITVNTGVHRLSARTRGTRADPEKIVLDNAPTGSVSGELINRGGEAFFARLNDGTLATDWVRVEPKEHGYLYLATSDPTSIEFSRPHRSTPRWISSSTFGAQNSTWPIEVEIIPGALYGSGGTPVTPGCCTTTNADITITNSAAGIVLQSANGKFWRLGAENTGAISSTVLP